jgi:hypothetical protein
MRMMCYIKQEYECFIRYKTRGAAGTTTSVPDSLKYDYERCRLIRILYKSNKQLYNATYVLSDI